MNHTASPPAGKAGQRNTAPNQSDANEHAYDGDYDGGFDPTDDYEPSVGNAITNPTFSADGQQSPPSGLRPQFLSVRKLIQAHPQLRSPVIHELLRVGETMNIIAPPKTGKSWIVLDLALAVASGRPWIGLAVERGEVLIIDNELHPETMANRVPMVANKRGLSHSDYADTLFVDNLRGRLKSLADMESYFDQIEPGRFKLIVLDAWYRFMEPNTDENDNGAMTQMYNLLDKFAGRLGCSFVCIHHSTKGNQTGKSITDVGAGAGAQSRAADAHLILRQHAEPGCFVAEAVARSWAPPVPICLRWEFPVWHTEPGLDPLQLLGTKPPKADAATKVDRPTVDDVVAIVREHQPIGRDTLLAGIEKAISCSGAKAKSLYKQAKEQGLIITNVKAANVEKKYTLPDYVAPLPPEPIVSELGAELGAELTADASIEIPAEPSEPSVCVSER